MFINVVYGTFCIMGVQVILYGKVNFIKIGAEAKASFKRAYSRMK